MKNKQTTELPLSVTVAICTHNRPVLLEQCLKALGEIKYPNFSTVIVDSAPSSRDAETLAIRYRVQYQISCIKGLSRARNAGMNFARSDIVAFLDDDMIPHAEWLRSFMDEFDDANIMAVTGPMLPIEIADSGEAKLRKALRTSPWGMQPFRVDRLSPYWFERANFGGIGDGNFAIRKRLDLFPGFNERLGRGEIISGGEDHYAYYTLLRTGFSIAYAPRAIVFHPRFAMTSENRRRLVAETVAYTAFLIWQHPLQTWRAARYLIGGILGKSRSWRTWGSEGRLVPLSMYDALRGVLTGVRDFLRSQFRATLNGKRRSLSRNIEASERRGRSAMLNRNRQASKANS